MAGNHKYDDGQILRESLVYAKTKVQDLSHVKNLNLWGSELSDVSIVSLMDNVEIISLSVNKVNTLVDFSHCGNLQELYLRKNNLDDIAEVVFLKDLKKLKLLFLSDNPCSNHPFYKAFILRTLPNLLKLDDEEITYRDRQSANSISDPGLNALHQRAHNLLFASGISSTYIDDREFNNNSQQLNKQHQQRNANNVSTRKSGEGSKVDSTPVNNNNFVNVQQYKIQMDMLLQKVNEVEIRNNKMEQEIDRLKQDQIAQLNKESDLIITEAKNKKQIAALETNQGKLLRRIDALEAKLFKIPDGHVISTSNKTASQKNNLPKDSDNNEQSGTKKKKNNVTSKIGGGDDKGNSANNQVSKSNMKNNNIF